MIALTQEKREELIACANEIKNMATSTHGYKVGNDVFGKNAIALMDIVLGSLSPNPEYWMYKDFRGNWSGIGPSGMEFAVKEGLEVRPLFGQPPVPEIQLARMEHIPCPTYSDNSYTQGYLDGCKAAIEANKRLNGLGE